MGFFEKVNENRQNLNPAARPGRSDRALRGNGRVGFGFLGYGYEAVPDEMSNSSGGGHGRDPAQPDELHPPQHVVGKVGQPDPGGDPRQADIFQLRAGHAVFHTAKDVFDQGPHLRFQTVHGFLSFI